MTLLYRNYLLKALSPIQSHSGIPGVRTTTREFWTGRSSTRNTDLRSYIRALPPDRRSYCLGSRQFVSHVVGI